MSNITRIITNPRRGRANIYNGVVYLGGVTAPDRMVDIVGQTQQALAKIDQILAEAGTDKRRALSAQIWLKDIARDFAGMNEAWDAWVDSQAAPTRATCQCEMGAADVLVEIIMTAAVSE